MPIYFPFLQLIASVRYLQLLYKADWAVKTLEDIIKCILEIEHSLWDDDIRHRTLGHRSIKAPLQRCRTLSLTRSRAAQLFLFFIWSAKAEIFACKLWRAWIQLLSTHFTHIDIRMDGCQFSVLAGVQARWLLSLLGFWAHHLKKKKKKNERKKIIPEHKKNPPQTFLRCCWANFLPLLHCKFILWKWTRTSSVLCQGKQLGSLGFSTGLWYNKRQVSPGQAISTRVTAPAFIQVSNGGKDLFILLYLEKKKKGKRRKKHLKCSETSVNAKWGSTERPFTLHNPFFFFFLIPHY